MTNFEDLKPGRELDAIIAEWEAPIAQAIRAEREAIFPSEQRFKEWAKSEWEIYRSEPSPMDCYRWLLANMKGKDEK